MKTSNLQERERAVKLHLDEEQKTAITTLDGLVKVSASAGTGKTQVLACHVAYLINQGVNPRDILCITYTNKAAEEMRYRIASLISDDIELPYVGTIHSFCLQNIIKESPAFANFSPIRDYSDVRLWKWAINNVIDGIDKKSTNMLAEEFRKRCNSVNKRNEISLENASLYNKVFEEYKSLKLQYCKLTFDDILRVSNSLLKENKININYKYVIIDECQDIAELTLNIVLRCSKKYKNLYVVGDKKQTIYQFAGANIKYFTDINTYARQIWDVGFTYTTIELQYNYRSTQEIINFSNRYWNHNTGENLQISGNNKFGMIPTVSIFNTSNEENYSKLQANCVLSQIKTWLAEGKHLKDIAILFPQFHFKSREKVSFRMIKDLLDANNIPYRSFDTKGYDSTLDIILYILELILGKSISCDVDFFNSVVFKKTFNSTSLISQFNEFKDDWNRNTVDNFMSEINSLLKNGMLCKSPYTYAECDISSIKYLLECIFDEVNTDSISCQKLYENISLSQSAEPTKEDRVSLISIHKAKGLQWDNIIVVDAMINSGYRLGEAELCKWYVAFSRAAERLHVIGGTHSILTCIHGHPEFRIIDYKRLLAFADNSICDIKSNDSQLDELSALEDYDYHFMGAEGV